VNGAIAATRRHFGAVLVAAAAVWVGQAAWSHQPVTVDSLGRLVMFALPIAGIYAVNATGLVVVYSATGIFNLAQGSIGMFGAFIYWTLLVAGHVPEILALVLAVFVFAPLFGLLLDAVLMRRLAGASLIAKLVGTLGLGLTLLGVANLIWNPNSAHAIPPLIGGTGGIKAFGIILPWHRVITIGAALGLALLLRWLLFRTRVGISMRAIVDNSDLGSLYGIRHARVSGIAWILGSGCATIASILIAPELGNLSAQTLSLLIIDAFAAAVFGRLKSLPMTYVGALLLGLVVSFSGTFLQFGGRWAQLPAAIPSIALLVVLVLLPSRTVQLGRPLRTYRIESVPSLRTALSAAGVAVAVAALLGAVLPLADLVALAVGVTTAIILLGLVPLIGWAGQPFLAPFALAGVGAWLAWRLEGDLPALVILVVAGVVTASVGILTALPALRLRGLYMALASLAFANIAVSIVFPLPGMLESDHAVTRPRVLGINLDSAASFLVFSVVIYVLLAVGMVWVRRSRLGRRMVATRDSEAGAAGVGIRLALTTGSVFAVSGLIAGVGGAMLVEAQKFVSVDLFPLIGGVSIVLSLVVFGVGTTSGPLLAGLSLAMTTIVSTNWLHGTWGEGLSAVGPSLAALGLINFPRGSVPQVVAGAKEHPVALGGRVLGLAAGGTLGIALHLPGLVGVALAVSGAMAGGLIVSLIEDRRHDALSGLRPRRASDSVLDVDDPGLGLTAELNESVRTRLDVLLGISGGVPS